MNDTRANDAQPADAPSRHRRWIPALLGGFVAGLLTAGVLVWQLMPGMMIEVTASRYDSVDRTVEELRDAVEREGWVVAGVKDMRKSLANQGVDFPRQVKLVEICKPEYAESVLTTDRKVATLMPCALAVYEGDDGRVRVSRMNTGLMGRMFGGNIARVMGDGVAPDEQRILESIAGTRQAADAR